MIKEKVKKEILRYWRMNLSLYPMLSILAFRYLSPPCGSVPSEREFKIASKISQGDRICLLPTNIEKLLFLKYNHRAFGFGSLKFPRPPPELVLPNQNVEVKESDGDDEISQQIE